MAKCKHWFSARHRHSGFTLMELMVTLAIAAILAGLAAPSISEFIVKNRMNGVASEFSGGILRARNEAVSRNTCVTLCMSSTAANAAPACTVAGKNWQVGWIAFLNTTCDASRDAPAASNDLIFAKVASGGEILLDSTDDTPVRKMMFNASGAPSLPSSSNFSLLYKDAQNTYTKSYGVNICIDAQGRSRLIPSDKKCSNF
ncbi:MAG: GspH/FimT family pseudopilin [Delftia acidovorans]|jgi:type IV fimbrial biogenesis protein FimT|uniref:GspH/FimT family pseudopilin n=1 Tax=Delftia acidovorans TaxID=80866 RepID=UPI002817FF72|nr:GspH/FimT family pseudopilin [Delftia acidovorans]MDR3017586.1 GspH/FimT family pseudopilin [Delftia acidovorans]